MGPTLNGPVRNMVGFEYCYNGIIWAVVWHTNKAIEYRGVIDLCRWSVKEILLYVHIHFRLFRFFVPPEESTTAAGSNT